ncbi:MAG: alpha-hydroxy-acid oxidizing protein, partial [Casimicrobiaceae bacterium]
PAARPEERAWSPGDERDAAAAAGEAGARRARQILTDELARTVHQCGTGSVPEIDSRIVV